jgi:hypothetical protein
MAVERIPRGKFTKEFREEAVRMIIEEKISIPEVGLNQVRISGILHAVWI